MADLSGVNYAKTIAHEQANAGELGGVVKCLFESYVGAVSASDVLLMGKLPKGARILSITVAAAMGAAPTFAKVTDAGASTALAVGDVIASQSAVKITAAGGTYGSNPIAQVLYVVD